MNEAVLESFRQIYSEMQTKPTDWQWIGQYESQRMFGITQERAENYAKKHGGKAEQMKPQQ